MKYTYIGVGLIALVMLGVYVADMSQTTYTQGEIAVATTTDKASNVDIESVMENKDFQEYVRLIAEAKALEEKRENLTTEYEREFNEVEERLSEIRDLELSLIERYKIPSFK